ncbi:NAD-dependent protein deacetylase sirtuin-2-like [Saccoglossus kowalevskii]
MGTSLVVQPFASLVNRVPEDCPRLLINREKSGQVDPLMQMLGFGRGMDFDSPNNYRDVAFEGTCDDGCVRLAELLGWKDELLNLVETEHARIDAEKKKKKDEATKTNKTGKAATSDTTPKAETKLNNPDIPSEKL